MVSHIAREGKAFNRPLARGRHDIEFEREALPGDGVQASAFDLRFLLEGVGEDLENFAVLLQIVAMELNIPVSLYQ